MTNLAAVVFLRGLRRWRHGELIVDLPDGRRQRYGEVAVDPEAAMETVRIEIRDEAFFRRVLTGGETGAGESYILGEWTCDDLPGLIRLGVRNRQQMKRAMPLFWLGAAADWIMHRLRPNTRAGSRRNIHAHYDLGNDFFEIFLDPSMTYSCGVFPRPGISLEDAQREKYRRMARAAGLRPGDHVLEIGCGWGGFAEFAALELDCRVTGITISREQAAYAVDRIRRAGLEANVDIQVRDYRDVRGTYGAIVSIEMLEAVGHRCLGDFFAVCDRSLAPGGRAAIQTITIPNERYLRYRLRPDYIQKYIFPGAHLPSLGAIERSLRRNTSLRIAAATDIGPHYPETLRRWRRRLHAGADLARAQGFDDAFLRRWDFYFAYCEGGFAARYIGDHQLVLSRPGDAATMWDGQSGQLGGDAARLERIA
ncbi:MAG: class I SAM-dependent methyltransferase [Planctomycetota bacterium]